MAKPNDTPIAPSSPNPIRSTVPLPLELAALLESLLASHASAPPVPKPPKHARPARIRPRRRVTVGVGVAPASNPGVPKLHLAGHWLALAGFGQHTRVRVHVAYGLLVLVQEPPLVPPRLKPHKPH